MDVEASVKLAPARDRDRDGVVDVAGVVLAHS